MSFDPVVFNEVKKLAREIGELALVPSNFKADNYVDTGTFIDATAYPNLADRFVGLAHMSELSKTALPTVPGNTGITQPNSMLGQAVTYKKAMTDAQGNTYLIDTYFRVFKISSDGTTVTFVGTAHSLAGLNSASTISFTSLNGKFYCFIAAMTAVLTSTDCINWSFAKSPISTTNGSLNGCRAGNFIFAMPSTANATIYSTTDGLTWTPVTMPSSLLWGNILYNGTYYVAVVQGSASGARSTDGVNWTGFTFPAAVGANASVSNTTFLVPSSISSATAYNSSDATTWTITTMPATGIWQIYGSNAGFYITANSTPYRSATGLTGSWTAITLQGTWSTTDTYSNLRPGAGNLFYCFANTTNRISIDGCATWLTIPNITSTNTSNIKNLAGTTSCTMYLDSYNTSLWKSVDAGSTWTELVLPNGFIPGGLGHVRGTNMFIVLGATFVSGYITSIDNGATWSAVTSFPVTSVAGTAYSIVDIGRNYFALAYANSGAATMGILYTDNGTDWRFGIGVGTANFTTQPVRAVAFKDRMFYFIANHPSATASSIISVSSLTHSLTPSTTSASLASTAINGLITGANALRGMASDNNTLVVVLGATSTAGLPGTNILYSRDGFNWEVANTGGFLSFWDNVVWTGKFFVATQQSPVNLVLTNSLTVAISYDGMYWEIVNLGDFLTTADYDEAPRSLQVFANSSDEIYAAIANVKYIYKVSNQARPRIDFIPTGVLGTKYVVKAK